MEGFICLYTGPHLGVFHDKRINDAVFYWDFTEMPDGSIIPWPPSHQLLPNERGLGDKAYEGSSHLLCSFKESQTWQMLPWKNEWNATLEHYRARGEHVMHELQIIQALKQPYRGSWELFDAISTVTVHLTALKLRVRHVTSRPKYNDGVCGPWPHWRGAPMSMLPAW